MKRSLLFPFALFTIVLLATRPLRAAEPVDAPPPAVQFATVQAITNLLQTGGLEISKAELQRRIQTDPLQRTPNLRQVQESIRGGFDARFNRLVDRATETLTDEKEQVNRWLRKYCSQLRGERPSVREVAKQNEEKYLGSEQFQKLYEGCRAAVAASQILEIKKRLGPKDYPSAANIEKVKETPTTRKAVIDDIKRPLVLRKRLLQEADLEIERLVASWITSGVAQLEQQLWIITHDPSSTPRKPIPRAILAYLPEDIKTEILEAVRDYIEKFTPPSGHKKYGLFPHARNFALRYAHDVFDRRVAQQCKQALTKFDSGRTQLPVEFADTLRAKIKKNPADHRSLKRSREQLASTIDELVLTYREKIANPLCETAKANPSRWDGPKTLTQLKTSVLDQINTKGSRSYDAWAELATVLNTKSKELLGSVRKELAIEELRQWAPKVAGEELRFAEDILEWEPEQVDVALLQKFPVWANQPPTESLLFEETWQLTQTRVVAALKLGRSAQAQQLRLVQTLEPEITRDMQAATKSADVWVQEYCNKVSQDWSKLVTPAALLYRPLFESSRREIQRLVGEALNLHARDAQRGLVQAHAPTIARQIRAVLYRKEQPQEDSFHKAWLQLVSADWLKHDLHHTHKAIFPEVDDQILGAVKKLIPEQTQSVKVLKDRRIAFLKDQAKLLLDGNSDPKAVRNAVRKELPSEKGGDDQYTPEVKKAIAAVELKANVLFEQLRLVTKLKPRLEHDIQAALMSNTKLVRKEWEREFTRRVELAWARYTLAESHPTLAERVVDAIRGIVDKIIPTPELTLYDKTLQRQLQIVENGSNKFVENLRQDPKPVLMAHVEKFSSHVLSQWTQSVEDAPLRKHYPALLRETENNIAGILARNLLADEVGAHNKGKPGDGPGEGQPEPEPEPKVKPVVVPQQQQAPPGSGGSVGTFGFGSFWSAILWVLLAGFGLGLCLFIYRKLHYLKLQSKELADSYAIHQAMKSVYGLIESLYRIYGERTAELLKMLLTEALEEAKRVKQIPDGVAEPSPSTSINVASDSIHVSQTQVKKRDRSLLPPASLTQDD